MIRCERDDISFSDLSGLEDDDTAFSVDKSIEEDFTALQPDLHHVVHVSRCVGCLAAHRLQDAFEHPLQHFYSPCTRLVLCFVELLTVAVASALHESQVTLGMPDENH